MKITIPLFYINTPFHQLLIYKISLTFNIIFVKDISNFFF
jgi:hypothetical protein